MLREIRTDDLVLPDLSKIIGARLEAPGPLVGGSRSEAGISLAVGSAVVRQLARADSAPGGATPIRGSRIGECARALAYRLTDTPAAGRPIDARARMVFALGDMVEGVVTAALEDGLARDTGAGALRLREVRSGSGQSGIRLQLQIPKAGAIEVPGHPDGVIIQASNGAAVAALEVKSASSYRFDKVSALVAAGVSGWRPDQLPADHRARKKLIREDIRPGEWFQAQTYLTALELPWMGVVYCDKSSGALVSWWEPADPGFRRMISHHLAIAGAGRDPAEVAAALSEGRIPRRLGDGTRLEAAVDLHKTTGRPNKKHGRLPWQCVYCSFWRKCWPGAEERLERDWNGRSRRWIYDRAEQ